MTIVTPNKVDAKHLEEVKTKMLEMGAPVIRMVDFGENLWVALEGSHRLVAAEALGITPIIDEIEYTDDTINIQWDGDENYEWVVSELADIIRNGADTSEIVYFDAE